MEPTLERAYAGMRVLIDRTLCVGFGDCIEAAGDVFELDEEGICRFREEAVEVESERLLLACRICPVDALTVFDADGRQVAP